MWRFYPTAFLVALLLAGPATAAPLEVVTPGNAGLSAERLQVLTSALNAEIEKGRLPGAVIAVARRGKVAHFEALGHRDPASKAAMPRDAIFSIASMTKPMVSVAIMMLHDEGRLFLSDPVGKHIPAMASMQVGTISTDTTGKATIETKAAKRQPTIQDLLRHTSGITYGGRGVTEIHKLWPMSSSWSSMNFTGAEFTEKIGKLPLLNEPGAVWDYSLSTDVLGLVVESVSGKPLASFLAERIWIPLGMTDTSFNVPEAKQGRYARAFANDPLTGKPQTVLHASGKPLKFDCGGGCAVSTALDYLRFSQMLLNGGTLDGKRLLSRKTVEFMTADHLTPEVRERSRQSILAEGYGFGLGVSVRSKAGIAQLAGSAGDYNWGGAFGTYFWVDPKEELAVVYMSAAPGDIRSSHRNMVKNLVMQAIAD